MGSTMESRMTTMEKWTREHETVFLGMQTDMEQLKDDMAELRSAMQELIIATKRKTQESSESSESDKSVKNSEQESEEEENPASRWWLKKVELPTFEGIDPFGWLNRAGKFFTIQKIKTEERLNLAHISMEGDALHWFQFWLDKNKNAAWKGFSEAILRRFGGEHRRSVFEYLAGLKQRGSMDEFIYEFELLIARVKLVPEVQLMGYFMNGLRKELRGLVRPHHPRTLVRAMEMARDVEK
uniref:Uncharacterized protein LOC105852001 n=1 Tax=Cicer arietinum TaxID=3827 RepID=A0A1S3E6M3_CICAR|nr:uncharacterized protein LOC105852001 [Cicer arietinum]